MQESKATGDLSTIRAFFALVPPVEIQESVSELIEDVRKKDIGKVRWVKTENLHLTLQFIGELNADLVEPITKDLAGILNEVEPFEASFTDLHLFPNERRPKVIALGLSPEKCCAELSELVTRTTARFGVESDPRPYKAHLTVGRVKSKLRRSILAGMLPDRRSFMIDSVCLIQSTLGSDGPVYKELWRGVLGK